MPRRPSFDPIETPDGWMVNLPKTMTAGGKGRARRFFPDFKSAEKFSQKKRQEYHTGQRGNNLPVNVQFDAARAWEILEPLGITLTEAAKSIAAQGAGAESNETFRERFRKAVLEGEGRWSSRYAGDMGKLPGWVGSEIMALRCAAISRPLLRNAIMENGAKAESTIQARLRYAMAVLNHRPRYRKISKIEILSDKQCAQMLHAAENATERRAAAVLLFAGIRPSAEDGEITRLDWTMFGKREIYLPDDVTKTGSDRHVPITPRLRRLIDGHPKSGLVIPANWRRVYRRLRQAAGLTNEQDITRHTFASHCLAAYGEKATKDAMGHTAGSETLFRHYRRAVLEDDGKAYFGDLPREKMIERAKKKADPST